MEATQVLHMNGGLGETSYAHNSLVQRKVMSMTKPIWEEAITELYNSIGATKSLCIADLGCSSGPNSLFVAAEIVRLVGELSLSYCRRSPEFQIHLNDLPGNDFNTIFKSSLPGFRAKLLQEMGNDLGKSCFVTAVPGSFYGRLFPTRSLHFVHSSYSLMWLSKVPEGLEMNKENIYMASKSPSNVIDAYYEQFHADFSNFLRCRSEELVGGGRMVLTILGRISENASSKECCYIWELMALSLKEMVSEGLIEEEKLKSFNIPQYTPSPTEIKKEVEMEGSFTINRLEASEITWAACGNNTNDLCSSYDVAKCMRSVAEPLLVEHFGKLVIDPMFRKYEKILREKMSEEDNKFINVTVSMTRK